MYRIYRNWKHHLIVFVQVKMLSSLTVFSAGFVALCGSVKTIMLSLVVAAVMASICLLLDSLQLHPYYVPLRPASFDSWSLVSCRNFLLSDWSRTAYHSNNVLATVVLLIVVVLWIELLFSAERSSLALLTTLVFGQHFKAFINLISSLSVLRPFWMPLLLLRQFPDT